MYVFIHQHSPVNHFAQRQRLIGELSPSSTQDNLVDCAHQTAGGLSNKYHVRDQGKTVQLQLGNVCLKASVGVNGGVEERAINERYYIVKSNKGRFFLNRGISK